MHSCHRRTRYGFYTTLPRLSLSLELRLSHVHECGTPSFLTIWPNPKYPKGQGIRCRDWVPPFTSRATILLVALFGRQPE